jgi:superfamily II helicase
MTNNSQTCRKCLIEKPLSAFHTDRRTGNRKRTICSDCRNEQRRITRLTHYEYAQLLVTQSFQCAICQTPAKEFDRSLSVDHNHSTGAVRGLLCNHCNIGLGNFKEDVSYLEAAIEYLKKHHAS